MFIQKVVIIFILALWAGGSMNILAAESGGAAAVPVEKAKIDPAKNAAALRGTRERMEALRKRQALESPLTEKDPLARAAALKASKAFVAGRPRAKKIDTEEAGAAAVPAGSRDLKYAAARARREGGLGLGVAAARAAAAGREDDKISDGDVETSAAGTMRVYASRKGGFLAGDASSEEDTSDDDSTTASTSKGRTDSTSRTVTKATSDLKSPATKSVPSKNGSPDGI